MNERRDESLERAARVIAAIPLLEEAVLLELDPDQRPWAVVVPLDPIVRRDGFVNLYEALRFRVENASVGLSPSLRPRGLTIARAPLPRTEAGRIDRRRLRELIGAEPGRVWPADPIGAPPLPGRWRELLATAGVGLDREISRATSLELDLGMDSLDRMALILALAEKFARPVGESAISRIYTLGDLVELFGAEPPEPRAVLRPRPALVLRPGPAVAPP
ncbi:MAG: acyl carrier protein, partial [Acidobacteriota bacterium]